MRRRDAAVLDLEREMPDTATAIGMMNNMLPTYRGLGCKAAIVIHGYGSTGTGGSIKAAVRTRLEEKSIRGTVKEYTGGEDWPGKRRSFINACKALEKHEKQISGNPGVTVVIFR